MVALVYYAKTKLSPEHQLVKAGNRDIWIRIEDMFDYDLVDALDVATPMIGEKLMNSVEI